MDIEKIKRYSLVEVALLLLFSVGLLVAHLIVKDRSKVTLADPIALSGSGLSVSMPTGSMWNCMGDWQYENSENRMILLGEYAQSSRSKMGVHWLYALSTPDGSERELLERYAHEKGAQVKHLNVEGQSSPMLFAKILFSDNAEGAVYMGMMRLDANRSLALQVISHGMSELYVENVIKAMAASIQYQPPQELTDGSALMDAFLQTQIRLRRKNSLKDETFLIKNKQGKNRGYYYARQSQDRHGLREMEIRQFESKTLDQRSTLSFDLLEREHHWKTDLVTSRVAAPISYQIESDESGALQVKYNAKEVKTIPPNHSFVPEPLLTELASVFLDSQHSRIIIDVLSVKGWLMPVRLTKLSPDKAQAKSESETVDAVVRIDFLGLLNSYEELLFDRSQDLLGKFVQHPNHMGQIWDAVPLETLQEIFQENFQPPKEELSVINISDTKNIF